MGKRSIGQQVAGQAQKTLRGKAKASFDQIRERYFWSSYYFTPDANGYISSNRYTLFTTPVGSNGQGFPSGQVITERESNWKSQNRVPDNQNFQIMEIGCQAMNVDFPSVQGPVAAAGLSNLFQSAVLSITYLTNSVPLGILADFPQSGGPFWGVFAEENDSTHASVANTVYSNGIAAPALRRKFKIPILLPNSTTFSFNIDVPRPTYVGAGSTAGAFLVRVDFFARETFDEQG